MPDFSKDAAYKSARKWSTEFRPAADLKGTEAILDFAIRSHSSADAACELLDKKADDLIRTSALIVGLLVAAAKIGGLTDQPVLLCGMAIAVLALLVAILFCCRLRQPVDQSMGVDPKSLLELAGNHNYNDAQMRAFAAASYNRSTHANLAVGRWKSRQLYSATISFVVGVAALAIALVSYLIRLAF